MKSSDAVSTAISRAFASSMAAISGVHGLLLHGPYSPAYFGVTRTRGMMPPFQAPIPERVELNEIVGIMHYFSFIRKLQPMMTWYNKQI